MACLSRDHAVIPGLRVAKSPESRTDAGSGKNPIEPLLKLTKDIGSGFRAEACGLPRKDEGFYTPGRLIPLQCPPDMTREP